MAGAFLLLSPLISAFNTPRTVLGIPLILLYIFGVWIGLIILGAWLSRRQTSPASPDPADPQELSGPPGSREVKPRDARETDRGAA